MELICHWIVRTYRGPVLKVAFMKVWQARPPGHPPHLPDVDMNDIPAAQRPNQALLAAAVASPLRSWPYHKQRTTPLQRTQAGQVATVEEVEQDKARARRWAWQQGIRSPTFWSPTARDYDRYLWWCFEEWQNDGAADVRKMYYEYASAWGTYQPSALGMYRGVIPPQHAAPYPPLPGVPVRHTLLNTGPLELGIPDVDQRVTPLQFSGGGQFTQLLLNHVFNAAIFPGLVANPLDWSTPNGVEPGGLVHHLAWLVGFWLGDGGSHSPRIWQSDAGRRGGDHRPAIAEVQLIAQQVHAAIGSPGGAWIGGALFPQHTPVLPFSAFTPHIHRVQRETFQVNGQSWQPRSWRLYPALHDQAGNWFSRLLNAVQLLAAPQTPTRKHFPLGMLAASVDVRRYLLAGYIDADGCLSGDRYGHDHAYTLGTAQYAPIRDGVMHLARGLGYSCGGVTDALKHQLASPAQIAANDPRIDRLGYIAYPAWNWQISGVPVDGRQAGRDPTDIPVTMVYKQVTMLPAAAAGRVQAGWIAPIVYSWSCVPTDFARGANRADPLSEQVAGGDTLSSNPAANVGVPGAVRVPAWPAPFTHWRLPVPGSSAYVSIQVGPQNGSHKLLTAEALVVHN